MFHVQGPSPALFHQSVGRFNLDNLPYTLPSSLNASNDGSVELIVRTGP